MVTKLEHTLLLWSDNLPSSAIPELISNGLAKLLFCAAEPPRKLQDFLNNGTVATFLKNLTFSDLDFLNIWVN